MTIAELLQTLDYGPAPQSDAPAQAWLDRHRRRCGHFIGGRRVRGAGHFDSLNPATGQLLAQVAQATPALVEQAVQAAEAAQPAWLRLGGHGRARCLYALARELRKHARLFAVLQTLDTGRPIRETRDVDIPLALRHFDHHAGWAQLLDTEFPQQQALGVVGAIVPWNAPLPMLAWKVAPALACGNTVVFKPAEQASLCALLFAEISGQAGLPAGVFNIVTGDGAVGEALVAHPRIARIAFAGSTEVGRAVRRASAGSGKRLGLALGSPTPFIVFADADLDAAVEGLVDGGFISQGPIGGAGSRLLVHEGTAEALLTRLHRRMARIRVGDPLDTNADMGPLLSQAQLTRVERQVERARAQGATIHQASASPLPAGGCFYPPTLVTGVESASDIVQDEVFGPVLTVQTFRTPNEAVELANHTRRALAASVWSEAATLALDVAPRLKAGVVWVNAVNRFDAACAFGGCRESGFGRDGGRDGLLEYLRPRPGPARRAGVRTPTMAGPARAIDRQEIGSAVDAARAALAWERRSAPARAQVLVDLAEKLDAQRSRLVDLLTASAGKRAAAQEVQAAVECLFSAAAWADKHDGAVCLPPQRGLALALHRAMGVIGIVAPGALPLLGLLQLVAPALALGNRVVALPSATQPLVAAELQVLFDSTDLPSGALELVTGAHGELADTLAAHNDVDAFWWPTATAAQAARIEALSAGNLKRTWVGQGLPGADARPLLEQATHVKTVWLPTGS